jgi:DNA-binding NarL/FixJ family response regulator
MPATEEYGRTVPTPVSVVVGEDDVLMREGIVRLLTEAGFDVVAQAGDADDVLRKGLAHHPDVVVADVQMPPHRADDGLRAAIELRRQRPETAVLVLSQFYEEHYALDLIGERPEGVGYLLKERVGDVRGFLDAIERVAAGGTALDRAVVAELVHARDGGGGAFAELTPREREVMELMAEGRTNAAIARAMVVQPGAVEKHVSSIFNKLDLPASNDDHRRVLAVLAFLRDA